MEIFDGRYRSIMLTRAKTGSLAILDNDNPDQAITYTLKVAEYDNEFQRITNVDTSYLHLSGSELTDHDMIEKMKLNNLNLDQSEKSDNISAGNLSTTNILPS